MSSPPSSVARMNSLPPTGSLIAMPWRSSQNAIASRKTPVCAVVNWLRSNCAPSVVRKICACPCSAGPALMTHARRVAARRDGAKVEPRRAGHGIDRPCRAAVGGSRDAAARAARPHDRRTGRDESAKLGGRSALLRNPLGVRSRRERNENSQRGDACHRSSSLESSLSPTRTPRRKCRTGRSTQPPRSTSSRRRSRSSPTSAC